MRDQSTFDALQALLQGADDGLVEEFFVVFRCSDGSYNAAYLTDDLGDMLLQVRTEIIKAQIEPVEAKAARH